MKVAIVGTINNFNLERSYANAIKEFGYDFIEFDPTIIAQKYVKLGKVGNKIHEFLKVETWDRKMNREFVIFIKHQRPEIILLFGNSKILYGTLLTIKLLLPECKIVWVWPDTPMNLNRDTLDCSKLFNLSATYSKETVEYFQNLGFNNPHWVALACDPHLHKIDLGSENEFKNDISFVGMWRPEREFYLKSIVENFQNLKIEVYGNYWQRNCEKKSILKKWRGNGLYGKELGLHFNTTRINLNVIDDTNYPAANMRFFEIPAAGGLQLVSSCPEMEPYFKDKEQLVYFRTETEMLENIEWILNNENEAQMIRVSGQQLALKNHSYFSRFRNLLDLL